MRRKRTGRQRLLGATVLCVGLGVVTTVTIAWASSLAPWRGRGSSVAVQTSDGNLVVIAPLYCGEWVTPEHFLFPGLIPNDRREIGGLGWWRFAGFFEDEFYPAAVAAEARGWPMLCLAQAFIVESENDAVGSVEWGLPMSLKSRFGRTGQLSAPYRPLFPGFLVNTAAFTACWFLVVPWCGPRLVRDHIRRRRGRCPSCGYDLRGCFAGGCLDCGWGRADVSVARSPE